MMMIPLKDTLKLFCAIAVNTNQEIAPIDIWGAFLQGKKLDREVIIKPPPDIRKRNGGKLWRNNRALYGLKDAVRNLYYRLCLIPKMTG